MIFKYLHSGFYIAESDNTGDSYVIRTRPKGDGWMSIADEEGLVLATGQSMEEAKQCCEDYDKAILADIDKHYDFIGGSI